MATRITFLSGEDTLVTENESEVAAAVTEFSEPNLRSPRRNNIPADKLVDVSCSGGGVFCDFKLMV